MTVDLNLEATDERGVNADIELDAPGNRHLDGLADTLACVGVEVDGRDYGRSMNVMALVPFFPVATRYFGNQLDLRSLDEHFEKPRQRGGGTLEDLRANRLLAGGGNGRIRKRIKKRGACTQGCDDTGKVVSDRAGIRSSLNDGSGVSPC